MTLTQTLEQPVTINLPKAIDPEILNQKQIDQLREYYVLKEPEAVISFLGKFSFLMDLLWEAPEEIIKFFPDAILTLRVSFDPESASEASDKLVIYINTNLDAEMAIARLDQLDDHWWLDAYLRSQGKMLTNL